MMGCRSNNLVITKYPIKVTSVKKGGAINIGKRQKPVPWVNLTQTVSLNFTKVHNLKSSLIKPLSPKNFILSIGLDT